MGHILERKNDPTKRVTHLHDWFYFKDFSELTGIIGRSTDKYKTFFFLGLLKVNYFSVMVSYFSFLSYESSSNRQMAQLLLCLAQFCVPCTH